VNKTEYEDISIGLYKIQRAFGEEHIQTELVFDKEKLLEDALLHLADLMDIHLVIPTGHLGDDTDTIIDRVSIYSGIRIQKINLDQSWWKEDLGMILAFINDNPCVLVPKKHGGYYRSNPSGKLQLTTHELSHISPYGYILTKPLPDKIDSLFDLARFTFREFLPEFRSILYLQLFLSFILMTLPILIGYCFNHFTEVIENQQIGVLSIALIINSLIYFLLSIFQSLVLLHLRFKAQVRLEPAIWDRLLKLTPSFFRNYNSGNIAYRASVVSAIQEMLTQSTILSLFSLIISFVSFGLMCYYDIKLALLALPGFFIILPLVYVIAHHSLIYQKKVFENLSRQSGFVFQIINSIIKIKVSATESRVFNLWADYFSNLISFRYKSEKILISVYVIHGSLLIIMSLILFIIYIYSGHQLTFGSFIAFNAAFSQFFSSLLVMTSFISTITAIIPLFEQSSIIYQAKMDPLQRTGSHIKLEGKITMQNVSFRYDENQPLIYKNLNLTINPGEIVGITGSSGAGKSTLFRILMGLEKPLDGHIYYDDINIDMINLISLRQQVGVATQRSKLISGTIFENIVGNDRSLTRKDAWDMIYKLGIENMIASLPMEIDTLVSDGMQTLSRGEQQKIILARALIKKPKILFLDESTSALDSESQAKVQAYLADLNITQLIIAHRLSFLKHVDRILVLHEGRIIQDDSFEALIRAEGFFAEMARHQFGDLK
jgi:ABC-type bacteriocin/lantibiotic exporter with double-glycine peptidase domain